MNIYIIIGIVFFILGTGLMMKSSRELGQKKWVFVGASVFCDLVGLVFLLFLN